MDRHAKEEWSAPGPPEADWVQPRCDVLPVEQSVMMPLGFGIAEPRL